jgi:hypothetical protein
VAVENALREEGLLRSSELVAMENYVKRITCTLIHTNFTNNVPFLKKVVSLYNSHLYFCFQAATDSCEVGTYKRKQLSED